MDEAGVAYAQAKSQSDTALKHLESVQNVTRIEDVKGAAGQLDSAKGKHDAAQAQLSYSEIRSPISGIVTDRPLFPGEMANAGSALLTVMDVSSVIARVNIPPAQAAFVKVGQAARIVSADSSVEVDGKVTVVSPAVDPQSTTVEVWVQAANPGERLRPGSTVRVTIMAGAVPDAVVVPLEALLPGQAGGSAVTVVGADSIAHEHKVETGVRGPDKVQILSGVAAGERVVTVGGVGLQDGAKVSAKEAVAVSNHPTAGAPEHWTARHGKPIIFVILTLVAVGVYLAFLDPGVGLSGNPVPSRRHRCGQRSHAHRSDAWSPSPGP